MTMTLSTESETEQPAAVLERLTMADVRYSAIKAGSAEARELPAGIADVADPEQTTYFVLQDERNGALLGAISGCPAAASRAARQITPRGGSTLDRCYFVGAPRVEDQRLTALFYYLAARDARRKGNTLLLANTGAAGRSAHPAVGLEILEVPAAGAAGAEGGFRLTGADLNRAAYLAFARMPREVQDWAADNLMTEELEGTVRDRADQFYDTAFFKRIFAGTLTRSQYVESVANNHQFVRWTTRLLGRLVAMTGEQTLRRHFIFHLNGEIDHDVLLENDLRYLGADVDYVKHHMVPCREIQQFMCVQESVFGFHQDPVLGLAVPFAIESATALMDTSFIDALRRCIAGWGYSTPGRGCTFLASHIKTDGGEDGHWEATKKMLRLYVRDETRLQRALNICNLVMDGVVRAYEAYGTRSNIEDLQAAAPPA
jgi:hypothetical protein